MADNSRYASRRPDDPPPRRGPGAPAGSDPLAELARLIGRDDPFADLRRDADRAAQAQSDDQAFTPRPGTREEPRQEPRQKASDKPRQESKQKQEPKPRQSSQKGARRKSERGEEGNFHGL